jgi:hypothetical protein
MNGAFCVLNLNSMVLDFKDIPEANKNTGKQDEWELFCRDALGCFGFQIIEPPSRGADGGKDMIVAEVRKGIVGESIIRTLVSCKHKAHSGDSVGVDEEINIADRMKQHKCDSFLGFYSTLPSSGLAQRIRSIDTGAGANWLDHEAIEHRLLRSLEGVKIAARYFPSFSLWNKENPGRSDVFDNPLCLKCEMCQRDLLETPLAGDYWGGMFSFWERRFENETDAYHVLDVRWYCKGKCDAAINHQAENGEVVEAGWDEIDNLKVPNSFLRLWFQHMTRNTDLEFTALAEEKLRHLFTAAFPYVSRSLTTAEKEIFAGLRKVENLLI